MYKSQWPRPDKEQRCFTVLYKRGARLDDEKELESRDFGTRYGCEKEAEAYIWDRIRETRATWHFRGISAYIDPRWEIHGGGEEWRIEWRWVQKV